MKELLRQLRALRKLPAELREAVAQRDYGSAVLLYSKAQGVFKSHGHVGLLRSVCSEAADIMQARPAPSPCVLLLRECQCSSPSSRTCSVLSARASGSAAVLVVL